MAEWRNKVATTTIDAALVQKMFLAGAKNLESKKEWINDLNVFPVPDGDSQTNILVNSINIRRSHTGSQKSPVCSRISLQV